MPYRRPTIQRFEKPYAKLRDEAGSRTRIMCFVNHDYKVVFSGFPIGFQNQCRAINLSGDRFAVRSWASKSPF